MECNSVTSDTASGMRAAVAPGRRTQGCSRVPTVAYCMPIGYGRQGKHGYLQQPDSLTWSQRGAPFVYGIRPRPRRLSGPIALQVTVRLAHIPCQANSRADSCCTASSCLSSLTPPGFSKSRIAICTSTALIAHSQTFSLASQLRHDMMDNDPSIQSWE